MLTWARKRVAMELDDAANGAKVSPADLDAWESGESTPLEVLRGLAKVYDLPLSAFLLQRPKPERLPTVDRRGAAGVESPRQSPELAKALHRAAGLQALAGRLHKELGDRPFAPVAEDIDPDRQAEQQRTALGITVEDQLNWDHEWEAFRRWRAAVEARGIYVMQTSLKGSDVRAFSLQADPPVIVLDRSDWVRARIFSLAHEYGHVITGGSGICIPGARAALGVEGYCNRFAGALLVPPEALTADTDARKIGAGESATDEVVRGIASRFKVSPAVMWYRLRQVGFITQAVFDASWETWVAWRPRESAGGVGQETAKAVVRDYGVGFPDLLLTASRRGLLTAADVSQYLGVRHDTLQSIESEVAARSAS
jgi:Zn-dependent peptidase ImmA (M78 family)/DNA-binding XRE family transcriptional regulator